MTFDEFKAVYSKVPRLTVEVILVRNGGVLLSKRSIIPYKGMWHIPGGTVYRGELVTDAVKRVAKHELGVEVEVGELLGYIEYPSAVHESDFDRPVGLAFMVTYNGGTITGSHQGEEITSFSEIPDNTIPEQKNFLEQHVLYKF